jgi:hypothetical protein
MKTLVSTLLAVALFTSNAFAQDEIMTRIEKVRVAYEQNDLQQALSEVSELEDLLKAKQKQDRGEAGLSDLQSLIQVLEREAFLKTTWSLSIVHTDEDRPPLETKKAIENAESIAEYSPEAEFLLAQKFSSQIADLLSGFTIYCDNIGQFVEGTSKRPIPIRFAEKDGGLVLIVSGIATESVYNTLRTTSRGRASTVATTCLAPKIGYMHDALKDTDVDFYGMTIFYGSKDFGGRYATTDGEMLALVVSKEVAAQFVDGEITEGELLDQLDAFVSDSGSVYDVKKIKISN